jgi:DMSO/TMAO reductase YedYZ molybdopterin-dependent catalytic subunit
MNDECSDDLRGVKEKRIRTKEKWAEEGRALTGTVADPTRDRRPPGQRVTADFPVLDLGIQPNLTTKEWSLSVGGQVENQIKWDWAALMAQPQQTFRNDIHCVTTWSRYDNTWLGVPMRELLRHVKPKAAAKALMLRSFDGYTTNILLSDVDRDDVFIAHTWNGAPLAREHGGPVRLVVPHLYFWKSAKWLRHITFLDRDQPGYWEVRGYNMRGDPWKEERYG